MFGLLKNLGQRIRTRGVRNAARYAMYRLDDEIRFWRLGLRAAMHATCVHVPREEAGLADADCCPHWPSFSYRAFRTVMQRFVRHTADDVFLDYGSGLGNVVLMAATFPFRKVIGVECSDGLSTAAGRIIAPVRGRLHCRDIQLLTADAATYELPEEVNVLYFFNPFRGALLRQVIGNIKESLAKFPRPLQIVYNTPDDFERAVRDRDWLVKKGEAVFPALSSNRTVIYENRR